MNGTSIKEIRLSIGMSQKEFSNYLEIPLSTLTKWEQDVSRPPTYVFRMLRHMFPSGDNELVEINGPDNKMFYLNTITNEIKDCLGNTIKVKADLTNVNRHNLGIYLDEFFSDYYGIEEKLNKDLEYDVKEGIIW